LCGLVIAAVVFIASGGHVRFLRLFFLLPSGAALVIGGVAAAGGDARPARGSWPHRVERLVLVR
jgi:hypothetical protein